jgi:hypothetical protein
MDEKCPICGGKGSRVCIPSYFGSAVMSFQCGACGYSERLERQPEIKEDYEKVPKFD